MLRMLRGLVSGDDAAVRVALTPEQQRVTGHRVAADGGPVELTLGKQVLRLYPETPTAAGAQAGPKDWIIVDPESFFSGVAGFARLGHGTKLVVGRDNEQLNKVFDFPTAVARRHLSLCPRSW